MIGRDVPLLAVATPLIGHFQIRNRGTRRRLDRPCRSGRRVPRRRARSRRRDRGRRSRGRANRSAPPTFFDGIWDDGARRGRGARRGALPGLGRDLGVRRGGGRPPPRRLRHRRLRMRCPGRRRTRFGRAAIALFGVASTPVRAEAAERALVGADAVDGRCGDDRPPGRRRAATRPTTSTHRAPCGGASAAAVVRRALAAGHRGGAPWLTSGCRSPSTASSRTSPSSRGRRLADSLREDLRADRYPPRVRARCVRGVHRPPRRRRRALVPRVRRAGGGRRGHDGRRARRRRAS